MVVGSTVQPVMKSLAVLMVVGSTVQPVMKSLGVLIVFGGDEPVGMLDPSNTQAASATNRAANRPDPSVTEALPTRHRAKVLSVLRT